MLINVLAITCKAGIGQNSISFIPVTIAFRAMGPATPHIVLRVLQIAYRVMLQHINWKKKEVCVRHGFEQRLAFALLEPKYPRLDHLPKGGGKRWLDSTSSKILPAR